MNSKQLIAAIEARDLKQFKSFLGGRFDLDAPLPEPQHRTPLNLAIDYRADEIAVALIKAGAKLDRDALNLVWAVCIKDAEIVRLFLDQGADVNAESIMGTSLEVAAHIGLPTIVRMLVDADADLDAGSGDSYPLKAAVKADHAECSLILIEAGAKAKPEDHLLSQAVHKRHREVACALIKAGADVSERSDITVWNDDTLEHDTAFANATPLVIASATGQQDLVLEQPFVLTGIGWDFLVGRFTTKIKQPLKLAERMYRFCPDLVDQGIGSIEELAAGLEKKRSLYFWWD